MNDPDMININSGALLVSLVLAGINRAERNQWLGLEIIRFTIQHSDKQHRPNWISSRRLCKTFFSAGTHVGQCEVMAKWTLHFLIVYDGGYHGT